MKRALIFSVVAAAALGLAAAPAYAGLVGNASFSRQIPVPVPSGATPAQLTEEHHSRGPSIPIVTLTPGAGDNRGPGGSGQPAGPRESEPGDDRGGARTIGELEPGDDRGGARTSGEVEPGDDHGHDGSATPTATATSNDDHGGNSDSGHSGSDG
jgi:hypothetical protein